MKRGVVITVLGMLAFAGFLYLQPFLTIRVLAAALEESDKTAIRERMDAERVRDGLRADCLSRQAPGPREQSGVAANVAALTLFGRGIELIVATRASAAATAGGVVRASIVDSGFEGFSRFHATLQQSDTAPFTVILERQADGWSVTAMHPSERAWQELADRKGQAPHSKDE